MMASAVRGEVMLCLIITGTSTIVTLMLIHLCLNGQKQCIFCGLSMVDMFDLILIDILAKVNKRTNYVER